MKEFKNPTDDFFRETLKDHRMPPSDAAKKAFLTEAVQVPPPGGKGKKGLLLLSVFAILALTGILFWANSSKNLNPAEANRQIPASVNPSALNQSSISTPNPAVKTEKTQSASTPKPTATGTPDPVTSVSTPEPVKKSPAENHTGIASARPASRQQQAAGSVSQNRDQAPGSLQTIASAQPETHSPVQPATATPTSPPVAESQAVVSTASTQETENATLTAIAGTGMTDDPKTNMTAPSTPATNTDLTAIKPDTTVQPAVQPVALSGSESEWKRNPWIPSIGLYYMPEWMFNTLEGTKFVSNFGIEGTFHFGKFSVRTGAGLSIAKGTNEVIVEYNDYLGTYNKLDSMDFTWNDPIHNYVPTMYLSKKDVWDSLMKLDYAKVVKRYTYLQIPLVMGYDFWQTEHVSMGLRAGPVMSILLTTKQLSADYDPGMKKIISVNDIAPEQVSLNWQVMAGINTAFLISKQIRFEVEPSVRYYFNSVYEKPVNNTKPWSVGIRAAFVFGF